VTIAAHTASPHRDGREPYAGTMTDDALVEDGIVAGRAALSRGSWREAHRHFLDALEVRKSPQALEGLSWAAWWLEDVHGCLDARLRAHHGYRELGDDRAAARVALWLGDDHQQFLGESAVASGWFARAGRLLERLEPGPEHGWLAVFEAHDALADGDLEVALARSSRAREIGRDHTQTDLEMFALATEGVVRTRRGELDDGWRCLDESATVALAGGYDNLAAAAWSCCLVMSTCERFRDFDRGRQWCQRIQRFSERMQGRFLRGVCRAHQGAIHAWHGSWEVADQQLTTALDELTERRPTWRAEAVVRLGHLRRRQGRLDEAEQLFVDAAEHPAALHGLAGLRLADGDPESARDLLDRVLRKPGDTSHIGQADALELLVRVEIAAGDLRAAADAVDRLREHAGAAASEPMTAALYECKGLLAAADGEHERACDHLEDATDLFVALGAPVEGARTRLALATSLLAMGRPAAAEREVRGAVDDLGDIAAAPERERSAALLADIEAARTDRESVRDQVLTARQVEVQRLVAEGLSDQQIAHRLVLSHHTVHRHVANIFTRLGCSSRPAAVAEAARLGLL
jgi:LuxR family transcriptional regulator, maltose regulon positive regulatory protein